MKQIIWGQKFLTGTGYTPLNICITPAFDYIAGVWPIRVSGAIKNLKFRLDDSPGSGKSWTCRLIKNNSDTLLEAICSDLNKIATDISNNVLVSSGDTVALRWINTGGATLTRATCSVQFDSSVSGQIITGGSHSDCNVDETYNSLWNNSQEGFSTLSDEKKKILPQSLVISEFYVSLDFSPGGATSKIFTIRKNGVKQDGTSGTPDTRVTISGASTDGTSTFTLNCIRGDIIDISVNLSGSPASSTARWGAIVTCSDNIKFPIMGSTRSTPASGTAYIPVQCNRNLDEDTVESIIESVLGCVDVRVSDAICWITSPGVGTSKTFSVRVNSATPAGSPTLTVSDNDNIAEDNTNNLTIQDTDLFNWMQTVSGTPALTDVNLSLNGEVIESSILLPFRTRISAVRVQ